MAEPTETESRETIDEACDAFLALWDLAHTAPQALHDAPKTTPVGRLDEVGRGPEPGAALRQGELNQETRRPCRFKRQGPPLPVFRQRGTRAVALLPDSGWARTGSLQPQQLLSFSRRTPPA